MNSRRTFSAKGRSANLWFSAQPHPRTSGKHLPLVVVGVCGLLLLAGCAHPEPSLTLAGPIQDTTSGPSTNRLEDPGLRKFIEQQLDQPVEEWPLHTWDFSALSLAALYFDRPFQAARQQSRDARTEWALAGGEREEEVDQEPAWLSPQPMVHLEPRFRSRPEPGGRSLSRSDIKTTRRLAQAQHRARASLLHAARIAWQVRTIVHTNVLTYVAAQRAESLLQELESNQVQLLRSAELLEARGVISSSELSGLRIQLPQIRLVLMRARLVKMSARLRLVDSLNVPVSALLPIEVTYDFFTRPVGPLRLADLRDHALRNRLDLLQVLTDYVEAEVLLRLEVAKRKPEHSLPFSCNWDRQSQRWVINLNLDLPASMHRHAAIAQAEARRSVAAARLLSLQSDIIDEVERCAAIYRLTVNDVTDIDFLLATIHQHHGILDARYKVGLGSAFELLLARVQLNAATLSKLEADVRVQEALGSLENVLHQPVERIGLTDVLETPPLPREPTRSDSVQRAEVTPLFLSHPEIKSTIGWHNHTPASKTK